MNNLHTKRLVRKATIVAGRLLRKTQRHWNTEGANEADLRWMIESQMVKILRNQAEVLPDGSLAPKGKSNEWEFVLNPVDDYLEYKSQRTQFACSITLCNHTDVIMAALMRPEQNELFFTSVDQEKVFRNNEHVAVNEEQDLANCSIAVHIDSRVDPKTGFNFFLLQRLFQISGRVLTKGSFLFACTQVASGEMSGLIAVGVEYRNISGGLLLIEKAGGVVTDESGQPATPESKIYIASNGHIHDDLLHVFQKDWA